jgi:hypoxanthine phosphoribosyltransferase
MAIRATIDAQGRGSVRLIKDLDENIEGRHLIFVEDIIDTGLTLNYLLRILRARGPASLEVCTLFNKPEHRLANIPIRYVGFDLPDRFVVGFGLDYREAYRHLPYLAELRPEARATPAASGATAPLPFASCTDSRCDASPVPLMPVG